MTKRLTQAEYEALASAVATAESEWEDEETEKAEARIAAVNRAWDKIDAALKPVEPRVNARTGNVRADYRGKIEGE